MTSRLFLEIYLRCKIAITHSREPSNTAGGAYWLMIPGSGYCGLISNGALACIKSTKFTVFSCLLKYKHCPRCVTLQHPPCSNIGVSEVELLVLQFKKGERLSTAFPE